MHRQTSGTWRKMSRFWPWAVIVLLFAIAIYCNYANQDMPPRTALVYGLGQFTCYLLLLCAWHYSIRRRIVQKQTRRLLLEIALLLIFANILRAAKYYIFAEETAVARYLWYCYYIPLILIPLLGVYVTLSLGKGDDYRLSGIWYLPLAVSFLLLGLVLTNDVHQLVFHFPPHVAVFSDREYHYGRVYYLILEWDICSMAAAWIIAFRKCRRPGRRKSAVLPFVPMFLLILYGFSYVCGVSWKHLDLMVAEGAAIVAIVESFIYCGLIRTNTDYDVLFANGSYGAQITDRSWNSIFLSKSATRIPEKILQNSEEGAIVCGDGTDEYDDQQDRSDGKENRLVRSKAISNGYVVWETEISELQAIIREIEINRKMLESQVETEQEAVRTKLNLAAVREKNRLYNRLWAQLVPQAALLSELLRQYDHAEGSRRRQILGKSAVIGAYMKRRGNLLFLAEKSDTIESTELALCIEETFSALQLFGVECASKVEAGGRLYAKEACRCYDFLEELLEASMDDLYFLWLKLRLDGEEVTLRIEAECACSLEALSTRARDCHFEDGVWSFVFRMRKAGDGV